MKQTPSNLTYEVTERFLAGTSFPTPPLSLDQARSIADDLFSATILAFDAANALLPKSQQYKVPTDLAPIQIAMCVMRFHSVRRIHTNPADKTPQGYLLGIYIEDGPDAGTYATDDDTIKQVVGMWHKDLPKVAYEQVINRLNENATKSNRCSNPDYVPVANGVYDRRNNVLLPFSPDLVFLSKCAVDYVQSPPNPVIHNPDDGTDWDIESWMSDLSDDPEIVDLLWKVVAMVLRPFTRWNKAVFFYSTSGNNGKGTLCSLMRNLLGSNGSASLQLSDFNKQFRLVALLYATSIICDENDVGKLLDEAGTLKSVITNDVITIEAKYKNPISFQFFGSVVQCVNEFPRTKDKSESFYRRQLFVPFTKCFTGQERKYIKGDYLKRKDVLEYVLNKVLALDFDELPEPQACRDCLSEYKAYNDPIRDFLDDILEKVVWDLLPFIFLYDLYIAWLAENAPRSTPVGRNRFILEVMDRISEYDGWATQKENGRPKYIWTGSRMDKPEHLIGFYDLKRWYNSDYKGTDMNKRCTPSPVSASYRGIYRVNTGNSNTDGADAGNQD